MKPTGRKQIAFGIVMIAVMLCSAQAKIMDTRFGELEFTSGYPTD